MKISKTNEKPVWMDTILFRIKDVKKNEKSAAYTHLTNLREASVLLGTVLTDLGNLHTIHQDDQLWQMIGRCQARLQSLHTFISRQDSETQLRKPEPKLPNGESI